MKHLFVPYSIALALKEKGFDEPCIAHYNEDKTLNRYPHPLDLGYQNHEVTSFVSAPLYQQVVDWFREKHKIAISIWSPAPFCFGYDFEFMAAWKENQHIGEDIVDQVLFAERKGKFTLEIREWKEKRLDYYEALTAAITHALTLIP